MRKGHYSDIGDIIHTSIGNVTVDILLNKRFLHGDPTMRCLLENTNKTVSNIVSTTIIDSFPMLRFIQPFKGIVYDFISGSDWIIRFMKDEADRLLNGFDRESTDSFVESYFANNYNETTENVHVNMEALKYVLGDLVAGGMHTSAIGRYTLTYM